jgi:hypothetical protein
MKGLNVKGMVGVIFIGAMLSCSGCGKADENAEPSDVVMESQEEQSSSSEEKKGWFDASYTTETTISYSAGNDSDWSYGNQRKEFPDNEKCYVRIASKAITDKKGGIDNEINVTYKFTGAKTCQINLSDGNAELVANDDDDVIEYTRTIYAKKEKKAEDDIIIFQYVPELGAEGVTLEVIYDDQVEARYDARNAIYFTTTTNDTSSETTNSRKENQTN